MSAYDEFATAAPTSSGAARAHGDIFESYLTDAPAHPNLAVHRGRRSLDVRQHRLPDTPQWGFRPDASPSSAASDRSPVSNMQLHAAMQDQMGQMAEFQRQMHQFVAGQAATNNAILAGLNEASERAVRLEAAAARQAHEQGLQMLQHRAEVAELQASYLATARTARLDGAAGSTITIIKPVDHDKQITTALTSAFEQGFRDRHRIGSTTTVEDVSALVLELMTMVSKIQHAQLYLQLLAKHLRLPCVNDWEVVPGGDADLASREIAAAASLSLADEGTESDGSASEASSMRSRSTSSSGTTKVRIDLFGSDAVSRADFTRLVQHVESSVGDRTITKAWHTYDTKLLVVLQSLLEPNSVAAKRTFQASTFGGLLALLLLDCGHFVDRTLRSRYAECLGAPERSLTADSPLRVVFLQAQADILQRFTALTAVSVHLFEFAVELGLQFLPDGTGEKSHKIREFKDMLRTHAPRMDAALFNELVGDVLAKCGADDPPGDIVPSLRTHVDFSPAVKMRPAAAGISAAPGRGKQPANAKRASQRGPRRRARGPVHCQWGLRQSRWHRQRRVRPRAAILRRRDRHLKVRL